MLIKNRILLVFILLLAFSLRLYGINWDKGYHLHPDERMIIMVAERIRLPHPFAFNNILTKESPLNPNFFAYGSFPLYLLKITGIIASTIFNNSTLSQYSGLLYVGRSLSVLFDLLTVFLVYRICQLCLARGRLARLAAFLYAISVLPIQASHFYAVDVALTALSTLTLYRLLIFLKKPGKVNAALIGVALGLALATKITIILLIFPIMGALLFLYLATKSLKKVIMSSLFLVICSLFIFIFCMPFALIDFTDFKTQLINQLQMNSNPYTFPFTLQYISTIPYFYYLKNIFFWGLGIPLALLAFGGVLLASYQEIKQLLINRKIFLFEQKGFFILLIFFWIYFLVIGKSAVKFMRYLLPLYPLLAIFSANLLSLLFIQIRKKINAILFFVICSLLFVLCSLWPLSFMHIYQKNTTRLIASYWINQKITINSSLGVEHWDDRLPLMGGEHYLFNELTLYDRDTDNKWQVLSDKIAQTDYIILASNRLYIPLPKLVNCSVHKNNCYPITARYYQKLFSGELGFNLLSQFSSYPTIPLLNIPIIDDGADESFTVYDHPKIIIFKNEKYYDADTLEQLINPSSKDIVSPN